MTVAGEVAAHARRTPDRPALEHGAERLTYADLAARAAGCARTLDARGLGGAPVAVAASDPAGVLVAVLGAQLAGATAVLLDPRWPDPVRAAAADGAGTAAVLEDGDEALRTLAAPRDDAPDDARWIVFTSGSGGAPKPVLRRRRSWLDSFAHAGRVFGLGSGERVLLPGPLSSSLFLFGAMHTLWGGGTCVLGQDLAGATAAHCVPSMLPALLGVPLVLCGGAELPAALAAEAAARGTRVVDYYGATELSFVAVRAPVGDGLRPFPGVDVEVREGGEIWVRSPYLAEGPLRCDERGFATVGDVGALDDAGNLTVAGRGEGLILTGGASVVPEDVERVLRTLPGVADAVVVGVPHARLGAIVCAVIEGRDVDVVALRRHARARLGAAARPRRWLVVDRLPRTASGKPARAAARAMLR